MTFVIDIDDHLIYSDKIDCKECGEFSYLVKGINKDEIDLVNKAYKDGHTIILWTGRSWGFYLLTKQQLIDIGIKHHELMMGKPWGVYVDKDAKQTLKGLL